MMKIKMFSSSVKYSFKTHNCNYLNTIQERAFIIKATMSLHDRHLCQHYLEEHVRTEELKAVHSKVYTTKNDTSIAGRRVMLK
jgi:hypothetical protein